MKQNVYGLVFVLLAAGSPQLSAQSVTVFGNADAQDCYQEVRFGAAASSGTVKKCSRALAAGTLNGRDRAATLVNRGIAYTNLRRFDEARADFNRALDINAGLGEAYLNRGNTFIYEQRYGDAIEDFDQAIALETRQPHAAYYNRALAKEALKQFDGAYEDYRKAAELAPDWPLPQRRIEIYDQARDQNMN